MNIAPHVSTWGDLRIWYFYTYKYGAPISYTIPSKAIADEIFIEIDDLFLTESEISATAPITWTSHDIGLDYNTNDFLVSGSSLTIKDSGIDHDGITNTHNLTTDVDHDSIANTHNLTSDVDHDAIANFLSDEHIDWTDTTENFLTTGSLRASSIRSPLFVGTSFTIGSNTLDTNEWGYLDGLDQALKTTDSPTFASGRFDGGLGVGIAPSSLRGLNYLAVAGFQEIVYGAYNSITASGGAASAIGVYNSFTISGNAAGSIGMYNYIDVNGTSALGYGTWNIIFSTGANNNQSLYGTYSDMYPSGTGVAAYGEYILSTTSTYNNPSVNQIGLYLDWKIDGTDTGNKRWALYNASSNTTAGKIFLGGDNVKTYWGDEFDVSSYFDGTNLVFDANVSIGADLTVTDLGIFGRLQVGVGEVAGTNAIQLGNLGDASGDYSISIGGDASQTGPTVSAVGAIGIGQNFTNATVDSFQVGFGQKNLEVLAAGSYVFGLFDSAGFDGADGEPGGNAPTFLNLAGGTGGASTGIAADGGDGAPGYVVSGAGGVSTGGQPAGDSGDIHIYAGTPGVGGGGGDNGAYGTLYLQENGGITNIGAALTVADNFTVDTDVFQINSTTDMVGVRIAPTYPLHVPWITGDAVSTSYFGSSNVNNNQIAVYGRSYSLYGVQGRSYSHYGVRGDSTAAAGVYGGSAAASGVYGIGAGGANALGGQFDYYSATDNSTFREVVRIRRYTTHASYGANGIGGSLDIRLQNDNNQLELSGRTGCLLTDVTDGAEKSAWVWYTRDQADDGTVERMRLDHDGVLSTDGLDIGDSTNKLLVSSTGVVTMEGTAKRLLTIRPDFDFSKITALGKPTLVARGAYTGFSLPIYNNDDQELFMAVNVPGRWDGISDVEVHLLVSLAAAETANDDFNLQLSWQSTAPGSGTTSVLLENTTHDVDVETNIPDERKAQWNIYQVDFTIDYDVDDPHILHHDLLGLRLRRIAVAGVEATGDIIVHDIHVDFVTDKMFNAP